jgi:RNA polymerase-binding transcription factor
MTRQEALLQLQKTLLTRKEELRKLLAGELAYLHDFKAADATGDSADLAFEAGSDEISSRLAELDARELDQVERVLTRSKQGTYGLCEGDSVQCQHTIPMARLNALPCATFCISCERELEKTPLLQARQFTGSWAQVHDFQPPKGDPRVNPECRREQHSATLRATAKEALNNFKKK